MPLNLLFGVGLNCQAGWEIFWLFNPQFMIYARFLQFVRDFGQIIWPSLQHDLVHVVQITEVLLRVIITVEEMNSSRGCITCLGNDSSHWPAFRQEKVATYEDILDNGTHLSCRSESSFNM